MAEAAEKAAFLGGLLVTFKEQMHTDVLVKPAAEGLPIPTHKAVLVTCLYLCPLSYTCFLLSIFLTKLTLPVLTHVNASGKIGL